MVISTGLLLAPVGLPALMYNCSGPEVFPAYTASPFIYRSTSLATSMAHDYYIAGFIADLLIWTFVLLAFRKLYLKYFDRKGKPCRYVYTGVKYLLLVISLLIILLEMQIEGQSFDWTANLDQEAENWGMNCSPSFTFEH